MSDSIVITDGNGQVSDKALMELKLRLDPFFKGRNEAAATSGGSGWTFNTYPQSGEWGHLEFTGSDPHVAATVDFGPGAVPVAPSMSFLPDHPAYFTNTNTVDVDRADLALVAQIIRTGGDDVSTAWVEAKTEDAQAVGLEARARDIGDGFATAIHAEAVTDGGEDATGISVGGEANGDGESLGVVATVQSFGDGRSTGGTFRGITEGTGIAEGIGAVGSADGNGKAIGVSARADAFGSGDAIALQTQATASGAGACVALRCYDEAGNIILEARGDGTLHIRSGATWVADL